MSSTFGRNIKISIFGQSHSESIGVVIDGLPAGIAIDTDELAAFMAKRAPGRNEYSTNRREADIPRFVSGITNGFTCGAPVCVLIDNTNTRSEDYKKIRDIPRPSHADFTAYMKYGEYHDIRGGGHFSGRLTAPLCAAGGICLQILKRQGISIGAHIHSVGTVTDTPFDPVSVSPEDFQSIKNAAFPVLSREAGERMKSVIKAAKKNGDSVGGVIECAVIGVPAGIGEPMFDGVENRIASAVFAIPAVRGIEFGAGFSASVMTGTVHNDPFYTENGSIKTRGNNHGGVLGGITSGMPIIFRAAFKPTPSIARAQNSVSLTEGTDKELVIEGRHDPCIVPRAAVCVESAAAVCICDMVMKG